MQVIGPFGQDMKVIGFCKWLENLIHFPQPELLTLLEPTYSEFCDSDDRTDS